MAKVLVDIEIGPIARGFLDVLDLMDELIEYIPYYYYEKRNELIQRADTLRGLIAIEGAKACQRK